MARYLLGQIISLALLIAALALTGYGFYLVLAVNTKQDNTLPGNFLQRQLRGLGFIMLAGVIGGIGLNLAARGMNLSYLIKP